MFFNFAALTNVTTRHDQDSATFAGHRPSLSATKQWKEYFFIHFGNQGQ